MTVNSVSSSTLSGILSTSVTRMQSQMTVLEVENSTGRVADIGLSLGSGSGAVIALHQQMADLDSLNQSNAMVGSQLDTAANALSNVQKVSSSALAQVVNASTIQPSTTGAIALAQSALGALDTFTSQANAEVAGVYVFGGQNSGQAPMASYRTSAQASVQGAFQSYFGFAVNSAQVNTITATQMTSFLSGPFAALFSGSNWSTDWSSASATAVTNRVSPSQTITTSITTNAPAFQDMAMGLTMVAEFGGLNLTTGAYAALVTSAQSTVNTANSEMITANAAVGVMQNAVKQAASDIGLQQNVLTTQINARETVDAYEVATKVTALSNQLQVAYSLTSQLHKLSLVNFL